MKLKFPTLSGCVCIYMQVCDCCCRTRKARTCTLCPCWACTYFGPSNIFLQTNVSCILHYQCQPFL
uniref:Uncharacterized protein n=1 Tax=Oryza brachyantha TaxID=4533 RepID=J3MRE2_ORYBR